MIVYIFLFWFKLGIQFLISLYFILVVLFRPSTGVSLWRFVYFLVLFGWSEGPMWWSHFWAQVGTLCQGPRMVSYGLGCWMCSNWSSVESVPRFSCISDFVITSHMASCASMSKLEKNDPDHGKFRVTDVHIFSPCRSVTIPESGVGCQPRRGNCWIKGTIPARVLRKKISIRF